MAGWWSPRYDPRQRRSAPRGTPQTPTKKAKMDTPEKPKVRKVLSALIVAAGVVLVAGESCGAGERPRKRKVRKVLSALIVAVGFVLVAGKIYADSEPRAIPMLLVVLGTGWHLVARARARARGREPPRS